MIQPLLHSQRPSVFIRFLLTKFRSFIHSSTAFTHPFFHLLHFWGSKITAELPVRHNVFSKKFFRNHYFCTNPNLRDESEAKSSSGWVWKESFHGSPGWWYNVNEKYSHWSPDLDIHQTLNQFVLVTHTHNLPPQVSSRSVHNFLRYPVHKQTNKQTNT